METISLVGEGYKRINVEITWLQIGIVWEIFRSKAAETYMQWFKYPYSLLVGGVPLCKQNEMILYKNTCAVAPSQHAGLPVQAGR